MDGWTLDPPPAPKASGGWSLGPPPKTPKYASTFVVDGALEREGLRPTGDYRSPGREAQLRSQGAGTVAPGRTSNHSRGTPDAPGAHDFVPTGGNWDAALADARRAPGVKDAFVEGAQGGQGRHIHVDMADVSGWKLGAAPAPSAAGWRADPPGRPTPAPAPKAKAPSLVDRAVGYGQRELGRIGQDVSDIGETERRKAKKGPNAGSLLDFSTESAVAKTAGDVANLPFRPLETAAGKATQALPHAPDLPGHPYNPRWGEGAVSTALMGLGPEEGGAGAGAAREAAGASEALRADPKLPKPGRIPRSPVAPKAEAGGWKLDPPPRAVAAARADKGAELTQTGRTANPLTTEGSADHAGPVVGSEANPVERVDNALFRLGNHATADKIEAQQTLKAAPKEIRDPKVQEELTHAIEQKMIDPTAQIPEHLQEAEAVRAPWAERQRVAINRISERLAEKGLSEDEIKQYAPDSGYVPRRVMGKSPTLDEDERAGPLTVFPKRALTKSTGSMRARDQIVLEDENGNRTFEHRNQTNEEWKPGMQVRDPLTNKPVTVKQATINEIEGAGARDSKGNLLTYHKNALVNTIDETLKAERVERNLQVLDELTMNLKDEGLAHRTEWHYKNDDGQWVRVKANQETPPGFQEIPHLPQLKGWAFDPKVAEVLKDYYPGPNEPGDNILATVNRALNASLFITPFPHIKNVATMGFIGRGWDWIPGSGNYGRLMKTSRDAIKEVATLGPRYRKFLREGSGLQAGDDATRNFHQTMLETAAKDIASDPKIVKAMNLGDMAMTPVKVAKALYDVSHKILWNVNDMIMLQRQMELENKGMASRAAIKEAEKWIANYRIPSQVFKSRGLQQIIKSGNAINFGRYTYGKWRAIGEMAKGLAKGSPKERMDALGKVVAMGVMALVIYPMMDLMAKKITGNDKAKVTRGGELAPIDALTDPEKDWASKMASFLTPAPVNETAMEVYNNRNTFTGRHIVEPQSTPLGQGAQAAEFGADQFYPTSLAMEAMQPGGAEQAAGRLVGVNLPPSDRDARRAKGKKYDRSMARSREKKDPFERMIKDAAQ